MTEIATETTTPRTNEWLREKLAELYKGHFADVPLENQVKIAFGRAASRRLGSIRMSRDKRVSSILINVLLRDGKIPEQIICSVIAHEMCHYAHGFSSPLPRKYESPHAGGVITRELKKRGLAFLESYEKEWIKNKWPDIIKEAFPRRSYRRLRPRSLRSPTILGIRLW
jgi:hypothetical protein